MRWTWLWPLIGEKTGVLVHVEIGCIVNSQPVAGASDKRIMIFFVRATGVALKTGSRGMWGLNLPG